MENNDAAITMVESQETLTRTKEEEPNPARERDDHDDDHELFVDENTPANSLLANDDDDGDDDDDDDIVDSSNNKDDDEFREWILQEMTTLSPQVQELYPDLFEQCAEAVMKWRKRYHGNNLPLWKRLFKPDRLLKEVIESVPVIDQVQNWMQRRREQQQQQQRQQTPNNEDDDGPKKVTIVDLCSGKGYLSMLLSEILPPDQVEKCLLIDKAWPLCHSTPQPHHMSWEHIYGDVDNEDGIKYFDTWPIPLVTSKQNLKQSREIRQLQSRFAANPESSSSSSSSSETGGGGPVLILAVHLCGTLSIQAVKLFQAIPTAEVLLLKPCCLPDIWHARNAEVFQIGNYSFPTKDVCARGKWTSSKKAKGSSSSSSSSSGRWNGPPRFHLQGKFEKWCFYLHEAMGQQDDGGRQQPTTSRSSSTEGHREDGGGSDDEGMMIPGTAITAPQPHSEDNIAHNYYPRLITTKRFEVPLQTKGGFQNSFLYAEREWNEERY